MIFKYRKQEKYFGCFVFIFSFAMPFVHEVISGIELYFDFGAFVFCTVTFLPILITLKERYRDKRCEINVLTITGFTLGLLVTDLFILKGNLWPFNIIIGPVIASPFVLFFNFIVYFNSYLQKE